VERKQRLTRGGLSKPSIPAPQSYNFFAPFLHVRDRQARVPATRTVEPVVLHSRLVVSTGEAAIDAATLAVGVTRVLSYQAAGAVQADTLVLALEKFEPEPEPEPEPWPVGLVYAGQGLLPLKTRAFLDFAVPWLKTWLIQIAAPRALHRLTESDGIERSRYRGVTARSREEPPA